MRRIIDATIPACGAVATLPVFARVFDLPMALERSLGEAFGIVWCVVVGASMASILAGICLRVRRPSLSFKFEYPALIVAGLISTIYGVAIYGVVGLARGWTPTWFVWGIGFHCLARFVELWLARRAAKRAQQEAAVKAATAALKAAG